MRKKVLIGGLGITVAASAAAILLAPEQSTDAAAPVQHQPQIAHTAESPLFNGLPVRKAIGPSAGELFSSPPRPKPAAAIVAPGRVAPPAAPSAPAMPYRVAGTVAHDGVAKVVLAKGDRVFTVEPGDRLEEGYRVEAITADEVALVYEPLGTRELLALGTPGIALPTPSAPAAAGGSGRPAQLRWEGPPRVKTGSVFNVTLKVTSDEPVRGAPLSVNYDPKLLEPIAVRPGKFFGADASFSYRIDPSGAITVNAAGSAGAATDADLVILSFKTVRASAAAEVRLAALQLQRGAGAPLPNEPISAFSTAITP